MVANLFWGFGFTATVWSQRVFSVFQIIFIRFAVVGLMGLFWLWTQSPNHRRQLLKETFVPALFLMIEVIFQVWGLAHTSAASAGFVTVSYIFLVPILEAFFLKRKLRANHWLLVLVATVGMVFLTQLNTLDIRSGDVLMFVSALGASLHMLSIERLSQKESQLFGANMVQSMWSGLLLLPIFVLFPGPFPEISSLDSLPLLGIFSVVVGSTLLAFYFQMRAQRELSPSISSLLFLLESPLAAVFAFVLLGDALTRMQILGAILVLCAAAFAAKKGPEPGRHAEFSN